MTGSPLPDDRSVTEADIRSLISSEAREDRHLEFKSDWILKTEPGKREFLKAVSAFANTSGGDLVLGIKEDQGTAKELVPLQIGDIDQCRLQIQDIIRTNIRPPLAGVQIDFVALPVGGHVVVVRVPKTWAGPHILNHNNDRRFYIRDDGGKRPMDFEEVEESFLSREAIAPRLRNFRMERCAAILNGDTPRQLAGHARAVLHVLPYSTMVRPGRFSARELFDRCKDLQPICFGGHDRAFDLDGALSFQPHGTDAAVGYSLVFRSGAIEAVDAMILGALGDNSEKRVPGRGLEEALISCADSCVKTLVTLGIEFPMAIFLSFLNVRDYRMAVNVSPWGGRPMMRDNLYLPESVLDATPQSMATALFPLFNTLWNAFGYAQSSNYDSSGTWKP